MKIDKKAIRFYGKTGSQINCFWDDIIPWRTSFGRIAIFFRSLRNGRLLERS